NYWYENSDVVNDAKLRRFTPRDEVERKTERRPGWWAPSQWSFQLFAEQAAKMVAAGGRVGMGSHGQLQGLGAQWEIWNIASGGMPKYDVLRVDLWRRSDRARERSRLARGREARRPSGARQESARRHQEHEHDPLRDEE